MIRFLLAWSLAATGSRLAGAEQVLPDPDFCEIRAGAGQPQPDQDFCEVELGRAHLLQRGFSLEASGPEEAAQRAVPPQPASGQRAPAVAAAVPVVEPDGVAGALRLVGRLGHLDAAAASGGDGKKLLPWGQTIYHRAFHALPPPASYNSAVLAKALGAVHAVWVACPVLVILPAAFLPAFVYACIRLAKLSAAAPAPAGQLLGKGGEKASVGLDRAEIFFTAWTSCALSCFILDVFNVQWLTTSRPALSVAFVLVEGMLHWFVLETPLLALLSMAFTPPKVRRADSCAGATAVLNYNLLATCREDIDECLENMLHALLGNRTADAAAVLVSVTNDAELRQYELEARDALRERIRAEVPGTEGRRLARNFMVLHRVSRVLRKCGQYQDLISLSMGHDCAFTYCSQDLHGTAVRKFGEPLFVWSDDVANVRGRCFRYMVVLDSDTRVPPGQLQEYLLVGEAHPFCDIIQPAIRFICEPEDSTYTHLEALRQDLFAPLSQVQTGFFGKSPFFGKGVIRTQSYMDRVIGTPNHPMDLVPVDVLSHDTFEAAVTSTIYVPDAFMEEAPCNNYASWSEREMRWNRGELILACYFWPGTFGRLVRYLQNLLHDNKVVCTRPSHVHATLKKLDAISLYFGHGALRTMSMKLTLLLYILLAAFVDCHFRFLPLLLVLFSLILLPKLPVAKGRRWSLMLIETCVSLIQYSPEALIGSARVIRAFVGLVRGITTWTPQRAIEADFQSSNHWIHSLRYLWHFALCGLAALLTLHLFAPRMLSTTLWWNLLTVVFLPIHVAITSHQLSKCPRLAALLRSEGLGGHGAASSAAASGPR